MPGVPSGRGCDACRKQKKKCDQAKPTCSRCTRLSIPCIGGGKQRFKFKVHVVETQPSDTQPSDTQALEMQVSKPKGPAPHAHKRPCVRANPLSMIPRSRTTELAAVLVSRLEVTDVRYDITAYGDFLRYIPERLGTNKALDASVDAFSTAYGSLYSDQHLCAVSKYGQSLKALRDCLDDPIKGKSAETMCAIYLIIVVQGWIGVTGTHSKTHAEGLAYLLEAASTRKWRGDFETEIIITLTIPVIIEGLVNPRIKLQPWLGELLDKFKLPQAQRPTHPDHEKSERENPNVFPSLRIRNLARLPDFMREPELNHLDMLSMYHMLRIDCRKLHRKANEIFPVSAETPMVGLLARIYRNVQAAYSMTLSLALVLNTILQGLDPLDETLVKESISCIDEIMNLANAAFNLRPLGASHVPIGLSVAWAASTDPEVKAKISGMLLEYQKDFGSTNWIKMSNWWKTKFDEVTFHILESQARVPDDFDWDSKVEVKALDSGCSPQ
ncbi:hypothetical protein G7Z17_g10582 [Cylindrodendrum hubeiense]|uniref:Zn(2)-C6 fungal-type domain-containing protein n=1 Tax=Cylindrodendrum hubeiense TaxID=595255 RepID=A0A9P5LC68_9HYPO|nr:hypothetical protein G7Z17_g10582 [Cylindrodendrum hubeiense]